MVFAYHIVDVISLSFFRYWKLNSAAAAAAVLFCVYFGGLCSLWPLSVFVAVTAPVLFRIYIYFLLLAQLLCGLSLSFSSGQAFAL